MRTKLAIIAVSGFAVSVVCLGGAFALGGRAIGDAIIGTDLSGLMDLPRCVDALERPSNFIYQWNFVRNLKARMRRKVAAFPDRFSLEPLARIRSVRDFDEAYTAPFFHFRDAADYYYRAASLRVVDRIAVPTLILSAKDDPFVPADSFSVKAIAQNPAITVRISPHGGHCAFISARNGVHDGYWAEWAIVEFLAGQVGMGA